ncbi:MAG: hypothetical protein JW869_02020 [Candidatus Omnitrophica bacterium]|nr:hypothetical protein [Candidatus Omnitrophota bacterium]
MDNDRMQKLLEDLKGIVQSLSEDEMPKGVVADDYNDIVDEIAELKGENLEEHKIPQKLYWKNSLNVRVVTRSAVTKMKGFYTYLTESQDSSNAEKK